MPTRRLKQADRRRSILEAATAAFAAKGFDGARTREIAEAAGISEALLYQHFSSKQALHEAVLEHVAREQDHNFSVLQLPEPSTQGLVEMLWRYFDACVHVVPDSPASVGQRMLLLSLAGDGQHARTIYERSQKIGADAFREALLAADREGNLDPVAVDPRNAWNFLEHVGSMISSGSLTGASAIPYSGSKSDLVRQAVLFCGRGLGLKEAAISAHAPKPRSLRNARLAARRKSAGNKA